MPVDLRGKRGIGLGGKNFYNARDCAQWLAKQRRIRATSDEHETAARALMEERRRLTELKRRKLEGELVEVKLYRESMLEVTALIRTRMDRLYNRYGNELVDDMKALLDEAEAMLEKAPVA